MKDRREGSALVREAAGAGRLKRVRASLPNDGRTVVYSGAALRGPALAQYVVAEARDGDGVVFSRAELDEQFGDLVMLTAERGRRISGRRERCVCW